MPFRDIALLVVLFVIWAADAVVSRVVVTDLGMPPLFCAALRSLVVVFALVPWRQWPGKDWGGSHLSQERLAGAALRSINLCL